MIKKFTFTVCAFIMAVTGYTQNIEFTEYNLTNGLHVILHQENSTPVVTVGVMYHVGAKDEEAGRSGFAHFFEHLLFEGTDNIERGEWMKIVSSHGGANNANTTQDRTYYFENFPANELELGLWMESERMLHPIIKQVGVDTQKEVVKEEKRMRYDNSPYGKIFKVVNEDLFKKHPYKTTTIGAMKDIDAAKLEEFEGFFDKYYIPNNAALVISGDFKEQQAKEWIEQYFSDIPKGKPVSRVDIEEPPITQEIKDTAYDSNIEVPLKLFAYRTPGMKERDSYVLDMISTLLTKGKSSRMHRKMVDKEKEALQVLAFNRSQEDYGVYVLGALPMEGVSLEKLANAMDQQIEKLKNELISKKEYEKLQNTMENNFVNSNDNQQGIASTLASYYTMYGGQTNLINEEIDIYKGITRDDIKAVANKYLNKNQRLNLDYLPDSADNRSKK